MKYCVERELLTGSLPVNNPIRPQDVRIVKLQKDDKGVWHFEGECRGVKVQGSNRDLCEAYKTAVLKLELR